MADTILITGGAGFIGSHTADLLLQQNYHVRVLDNLSPQIHGSSPKRPKYLSPDVELVVGDIRSLPDVRAALDGVRAVYHMAAETGVGQSQYEIARYVDVNVTGTAVLWEAIRTSGAPVERVILASSRAVYGEGKYHCPMDGMVYPYGRRKADLERADWSMKCPVCGGMVESCPTDEVSPLYPLSVYAQTKKFQEELCLLQGFQQQTPVVVLRYFNVYGPRQALGNPYTGIIAGFCTRLLNNKPIILYEHGLPVRDFVHVRDVAQANLAALRLEVGGDSPFFNVGTGIPLTLRAVADAIRTAMGSELDVEITSYHRQGDILSCFADLTRSGMRLGYQPRVSFREGLEDLIEWLRMQAPVDRSEEAETELRERGLLS